MKDKILSPKSSSKEMIFSKLKSEEISADQDTLQIVFRMLTFMGRASQVLELHFQRYGLSQPGFLTLMLLYSDSDRAWTAVGLSKELDVKPPTMTGILDTLEKAGYLTRIASKEDRRKNHIQISVQGKTKFKKILPDHISKIIAAFSGISPTFLKQQEKIFLSLEESLQKLAEGMEK